jgi:aspartate racemase
MKTLGLLGGMSWESTAIYYRQLNRLVRERLGGHHSAALILCSVDFAPIAALQGEERWDEAFEPLVEAARRLEAAGADALMICANTMHLQADKIAAAVKIPLIHIADATADALKRAGVRRPLLLATRFTMEKDFYRARLRSHGADAAIPDAEERARLHAIIYDELVQGTVAPASKRAVLAMIERARERDGIDGVIFGCTEIGMLLAPEDAILPVFDTALLHVRAGADFALA